LTNSISDDTRGGIDSLKYSYAISKLDNTHELLGKSVHMCYFLLDYLVKEYMSVSTLPQLLSESGWSFKYDMKNLDNNNKMIESEVDDNLTRKENDEFVVEMERFNNINKESFSTALSFLKKYKISETIAALRKCIFRIDLHEMILKSFVYITSMLIKCFYKYLEERNLKENR
jgi:hypothetical protein